MATTNASSDSPETSTRLSSKEDLPSNTTKSSDEDQKQDSAVQNEKIKDFKEPYLPKKSLAFWAIVCSLCASGLMTALEATITSTALPTIIAALGGADSYIWVVNIFFLTMTAFTPLFGQLANIFGRRWPMIFATGTFTFGSVICGASTNINMLIAGRAIQGLGSGGVNVLIETIICDILPLRERGKFLAPMLGFIALGTALGPFFGGLIVQYSNWRWVFYLNVPVGGVALVLLFFFLKVNYDKETDLIQRVERIDWIGNLIFIASMVSILIALSWAGTQYKWSSFHILVPLILGMLGLVAFLIYEATPFCVEPTMPLHLFSNRTSLTTFIITFLHSVAFITAIYFLPVYFQGVRGVSPARSGIELLPTIFFLIPGAIVAGASLSTFGRYKPIHFLGFALMSVGFGLCSLLNAHSSTAEWTIFQAIGALGAGIILPVLLPAIQAPLTEADTALATSTWAFVRTFGMIWGATIPSAVFNNRINVLAKRITDPTVISMLEDGSAYEHATKIFLDSIQNPVVRSQVIDVFSDSLKSIWYVSIGFVVLGLLIVSFEKEIPLRKDLVTEFGISEKEKANDEPVSEQPVAGVDGE